VSVTTSGCYIVRPNHNNGAARVSTRVVCVSPRISAGRDRLVGEKDTSWCTHSNITQRDVVYEYGGAC
jgi:hypothetical protein